MYFEWEKTWTQLYPIGYIYILFIVTIKGSHRRGYTRFFVLIFTIK